MQFEDQIKSAAWIKNENWVIPMVVGYDAGLHTEGKREFQSLSDSDFSGADSYAS